jgi:DNA-binding MarR family transcriptional regulator
LEGAIGNPASLKQLPPAIHEAYLQAFTHAIERVFIVAAAVAAVAFLLSWLIEQRPLRDSVTASTGIGESFAVPKPDDSLAEMARALSVLIGRDARRRLIEQLVARAGIDLTAAGAWLLAQMSRYPGAGLDQLCSAYDVPLERAEQARAELLEEGMIVELAAPESDGDARYELTAAGRETAERLIAERRASLSRLLDGWEPERHEDLAKLLTRLAEEVAHPAAIA